MEIIVGMGNRNSNSADRSERNRTPVETHQRTSRTRPSRGATITFWFAAKPYSAASNCLPSHSTHLQRDRVDPLAINITRHNAAPLRLPAIEGVMQAGYLDKSIECQFRRAIARTLLDVGLEYLEQLRSTHPERDDTVVEGQAALN